MLLAPAIDGSVVTAEEDGRDGAAFEFSRPRVLRVFEEAVGERLVLRGLRIPEGTRHVAGDCIDQDHRGQFASGHDEITKRDLLVHPSINEAFVDAFIAAADEDEAGPTGEITDEAVADGLALWREVDDVGRVGREWGDAFNRTGEDIDTHYHAGPAAERVIVDALVAAGGVVANIVDYQVEEAGLPGAFQDGDIERASERLREEREDIDAHQLPGPPTWPVSAAVRCSTASARMRPA